MDLTLLLKGTISREISYFSYHSSGFSRVTFLAALSSLARRTSRTCTHREINKKDTWGLVQMKWFKSDIRILDSEEGGGPRKRRALNPNQVSVFVVFLRRSSCGCNSNCLPLIIIINRGKKEEENLFINSGTLSLSLCGSIGPFALQVKWWTRMMNVSGEMIGRTKGLERRVTWGRWCGRHTHAIASSVTRCNSRRDESPPLA